MTDPSPRYERYGQFRASKEFDFLFPGFRAGQEAAARELFKQVFLRSGPRGALPPVTHVVDLGCGDGSLLRQIRACWRAERVGRRDPPQMPVFIGFDNCSEMIGEAKVDQDAVGITFVHETGSFAETFEKLTKEYGVSWATTALCCLSHTWFHLDQEEIRAAIRNFRPAILVVDVFSSWDSALQAALGGEAYDEEYRPLYLSGEPTPDEYVCLRTVLESRRADGPSKVSRGVWSDTTQEWLFRTSQFAVESKTFQGPEGAASPGRPETVDRAVQALDALSKAGDITGGCDYLCFSEFDHESGWGRMRAHVFIARDEVARCLNEAYFEGVRRVVDEVLGEPETGLRRLLEMFPTGEVGIILPFDTSRTYARFIPLPSRTRKLGSHGSTLDPSDLPEAGSPFETAAERAAKLDLVLEEPNSHQRRFPSAYSLYQSLLARVSSPVGLLLADVGDYEMCVADVAYEVLETALLAGHQEVQLPAPAMQSLGETVEQRPVFFVVPYFAGTLPLFALVLQEPRSLPTESSGSQVFFALAQNLERQLRVAFSRERLQTIALRGLMEGIYLEGRAEKRDTLVKAVEYATSFQGGPRAWLLDEKPWQSWLIAMPGREIRSLWEATDKGNSWLRKALLEEKKRVEGSVLRAISEICKKHGLFSDECHEEFKETLHPPRVREALKAARAPSQFKNWERLGLSRLPLLFIGLLEIMENERNGANRGNAFWLLKSCFCRERSNNGDRYRRSFSGLAALLVACVERTVASPNELANHTLERCGEILRADFELKKGNFGNMRVLYESGSLESLVGTASQWGDLFAEQGGSVAIQYEKTSPDAAKCVLTIQFAAPILAEARSGATVDSVCTAVHALTDAEVGRVESAVGLLITMTSTSTPRFAWTFEVVKA